MTEVLHSSSSSSSPSPSPSPISQPPSRHGTLFQTHHQLPLLLGQEQQETFVFDASDYDDVDIEQRVKDGSSNQLSLIALLVTLFRKSFVMACSSSAGGGCRGGGGGGGGGAGMDIGWPTNVQHVAHVTFDRFNGFLGLPVEFEPEVPRRAPSASTTVFGVSTESMQLSFDSRGNSVPTILLLMQRRLYAQGGLQAEGIFRITAGNSQEVYVRDQLNRGIVPDGIDVHCLAGLIKAWFRELPTGVLDLLSPEQVMQCQSEEDCVSLLRLLPPTEAALMDWAINLMADVVQEEHLNKMNARNIAMVFAPNMTQNADPLTALMYAVQVMNFLKTLVERTLREREDSVVEAPCISHLEPTDGDGHPSPSRLCLEVVAQSNEVARHVYVVEEPDSYTASDSNQINSISDEEFISYSASTDESHDSGSCGTRNCFYIFPSGKEASLINNSEASYQVQRSDADKSDGPNKAKSAPKFDDHHIVVQDVLTDSKYKEISNLSRIESVTERVEAWW